MRSLWESGLRHVLAGESTIDELLRVTDVPHGGPGGGAGGADAGAGRASDRQPARVRRPLAPPAAPPRRRRRSRFRRSTSTLDIELVDEPGARRRAASGAAAGRCVLLVEDEDQLRRVMKDLLEREGYIVAEARDGVQALDQVDRHAPDIIVLDLNLPGPRRLRRAAAAPLAARHAGDPGHRAHRQGRRGQRGAGLRAGRRRLPHQAVPRARPLGPARGGARPPPRLSRPRPLRRSPAPARRPTPAPASAGGAVRRRRGLALIKPAVRAQAAYTLRAPAARRKLNQNESPYDLPAELKREVLDRGGPRAVAALSRVRAAGAAGAAGGCTTAGRPTACWSGNGSNELIQATLVGGARSRATWWWRPRRPSRSTGCSRRCSAGATVPVPLGTDFAYDVDRAHRDRRCGSGPGWWCSTRPTTRPAPRCPTGAVERVLAETGALVVCDEAYQEFGGPTALPLLARQLAAGGAAHVLQGAGHGGAPVRPRAGAPGRGARDRQGRSCPTT